MSQPDGRTPRVDALINARTDERDDDLPGTPPRLARVGGGADAHPAEQTAVDPRPEPRERRVGLAGAHAADRGDANSADVAAAEEDAPAAQVADEAHETVVETEAPLVEDEHPTHVTDAEAAERLHTELDEVDDDENHDRTTTTRPKGYASGAVAPLFRDEEPVAERASTTTQTTTVAPVATETTEVVETTTVAPDVVEEDPDATTVLPATDRDRVAEREARAKRLGIVAAAPPAAEPVVPARRPKRTTDKWHGSLGLFLLRLATAAVLLAQGYSHLVHWEDTKNFFAHSVLPQPEYWAIGVVIAEIVAALLLLLGLAVRLGGALLLAVEVLLLAFFIYGKGDPIYSLGQPHFLGDVNILLGTIGLLFLLLGGGGWTFDRLMRRNRARAKEERLLGNTV